MTTVCVDFDGTLHPYTEGWVGYDVADERPTPGAREYLEALARRHVKVAVYSARADSTEGIEGIWRWLRAEKLDHLVDLITNVKIAAVAYVDDRAVTFRGEWGDVLEETVYLLDGRAHGGTAAAARGATA